MTTASVLVLHTTEGSSIAGAEAAFTASNSWPHLIFDPSTGERRQYIAYSQPARALRNMAGGVETNRRESDYLPGPDIIQVEIVGYAADTPNWPAARRTALAQFVVDVCAETGIPVEFPVAFAGPEAYGLNGPVRLSPGAWLTVRGIVGHQHVPENTHWDPGAMNWLPQAIQDLDMSLTPDQNSKLDTIHLAVMRRDYDGDGQLDTPYLMDAVLGVRDLAAAQTTALANLSAAINSLAASVTAARDQILAAISNIQIPASTGTGATADEIVDEIAERLSDAA